MGVSFYGEYYTKECIHEKVLPFLTLECAEDITMPKSQHKKFIETVRKFSTIYFEKPACYVFENSEKLFSFAADKNVSAGLATYITDYYTEEVPIFVIWIK